MIFERTRIFWFLLLTNLTVLFDTTQSNEVEISNCGVGYELIQKHLEFLQYKFMKLSVNVMEFGETVENRQRSIEEQVLRLEGTVIANLSLVTSYSRQVLDLQTICSNHDRIRSELMKFRPELDSFRSLTNFSEDVKIFKPKSNEKVDKKSSDSCTKNGNSSSLISIQIPTIPSKVSVYCEMITLGGGWLVVQQRKDASTSFDRGWTEYRNGFGDPNGNFWIGLENLHQLTSRNHYELFVEVQFANGTVGNAFYSEFRVGSESDKYVLNQLGSYSGTVYDAMRAHLGSSFSTVDRWNGPSSGKRWPQTDGGGWWYYNSYASQLNSKIGSEFGIYWNASHLKFSRMMIRQK